MSNSVSVIAALAAAFFLSACASVSVDKVTRLGAAPITPRQIYVQDFETPSEVFRVDRSGKNLENFEDAFSLLLSRAIAERVRKRIGPSVDIRRSYKLPREQAWLITGRFARVNQGSRALRAAVGFGLGGTKVECVVTVYDLAGRRPRPILEFVTTGGTNAQPGAAVGAVMPNYYLLAADVIGKGLPGLKADVIRTSRQIVAVLSEYMAQEGVLPSAKIYRSKKLGKWP
jgi:hypothetical protein